MDTPDYPVDVTRVISDRFASLAPKQQLVARRLLEDPVFATFASAAES